MELIKRYFPDLKEEQLELYHSFCSLFISWNSKINMVSRKDIEHFEEHHLLHSLSIAHYFKLQPGSHVLDVGTGGGLPGLPLAIFFPEVQFTLVDSIGKKIMVVNEISQSLGLKNVKGVQARVEEMDSKYDYISGRAVKAFPVFYNWVKPRLNTHNKKGGILYLKGGEFDDELLDLKKQYSLFHLKDIFESPFFETKKLLFVSNLKARKIN